MPTPIDITGKRFGYLLAVKPINDGGIRKWMCRCICSNHVSVRTADLINGHTRSCRCNGRPLKHSFDIELSAVLQKTKNVEGCWLWCGGKDSDGYGILTLADGSFRVHRFVYERSTGESLGSDWVCHKCDMPSCINPEHLFRGNNAINVADKVNKGRQPRGELTGRAILSEEQVMAIRRKVRSGATSRALAKEYSVSKTQITRIAAGEAWGHLPDEVPDEEVSR